MKLKIYRTLVMLIICLLAINVHAEEIVGISDPFPFGDVYAVPLSGYAFVLAAGLIGIYLFWRSFKKRNAAA
ncbi:MAG: hypothetical protein U5Q03_14165 [Bacteroidota bacterium]|nr:hypothetical protein [Bacteroidota bacterium]